MVLLLLGEIAGLAWLNPLLLQVTGADAWVTAVQGALAAGPSGAPTPRAGHPITRTATRRRNLKATGGALRSATGTWSCSSGRFRDGAPVCPAVRPGLASQHSTACSAAAPAASRSWTGALSPARSASISHPGRPSSRPAWCRARGTASSPTSPPGPSAVGAVPGPCGTGHALLSLPRCMGVPRAPTWLSRGSAKWLLVPLGKRSTPTASRWGPGASAGCPIMTMQWRLGEPCWILVRTLESRACPGSKAIKPTITPGRCRSGIRAGRSGAWGATAKMSCWGKGLIFDVLSSVCRCFSRPCRECICLPEF